VLPDGRRALSGSWDDTLRLLDLETGEILRFLKGHSDRVLAVAVLPDGRRALSGSGFWGEPLRLWDLETGACLHVLDSYSDTADTIDAIAVLLDGRRALSGSSDKTLRLWDLDTGRETASFMDDHAIMCCAAIPYSQTFVAGNARSGSVLLSSLRGGIGQAVRCRGYHLHDRAAGASILRYEYRACCKRPAFTVH
jgi:WD40 repeat protein